MSQRGLCWGRRLAGEPGAVYLDWDMPPSLEEAK